MAEAQLTGLLNSISGTLGNFVFRDTANGIVLAERPRRTQSEPSAQQQIVRNFMTTAARSWQTITEAQREAWNQYATVQFPIDRDGRGTGPNGAMVFNKVNYWRQALQLPLLTSPPTGAIPSPVTQIAYTDALAADSIAVIITHENPVVANHFLYLESTPPILSPARNPTPSEFRAIAGIGPGSYQPLAGSGGNYLFNNIRFPVANGLRFGVAAYVISNEGLISSPTQFVDYKPEP